MPTASAMTATPFGAMRGHFRSLLAQFGLTSKSEEIRADLEAKVRLGLTRFKRSKVAGDHMSWEEFRWEYANKRLSTLKPGSAAHAEKRNKCATVVIQDSGSVNGSLVFGPITSTFICMPGNNASECLDAARDVDPEKLGA